MKEIVITVSKKTATAKDGDYIVNGNGDVVARFVFDGDWAEDATKTAVFVLSDGSTYYEVLKDNVCAVPVLYNTAYVKIGVKSAAVCTSTSATVKCHPCVTDEARSKAPPVSKEAYDMLCELIDCRAPEAEGANQILATDENGKASWVSAGDVSGGYTKEEIEKLLEQSGNKRRLNTTASETVELSDIDDYHLNNVRRIRFICDAESESNIVLTTADSGEISIVFEGIELYNGDTMTIISNNETWEFGVKNRCLSGVRWGHFSFAVN